jgi:hypothetical protein
MINSLTGKSIFLRFSITILIVILFINAKTQNICPDSLVYETYNFGDGETQFFYLLKFTISGDSVYIRDNMKNAKKDDNIVFGILSKKCNWNHNYSEGESIFQLFLERDGNIKKPTLIITMKDDKGIIRMLYENDEPRIFYVRGIPKV